MIAISNFVRRQTKDSEFSYWEHSDEEFLVLLNEHFCNKKAGYRDGVVLIPVPPERFYTSIVQLKEGDVLEGCYKARKAGEKPRKSVFASSRQKMPAKSVDVVLYRHDVLAENNEQSCDAEWEVISVNANPTEEAPIPTGALIANHLQLSGGTSTGMTDSEFVALLRKSVEFWGDKVMCCPKDHVTRDELMLQAESMLRTLASIEPASAGDKAKASEFNAKDWVTIVPWND